MTQAQDAHCRKGDGDAGDKLILHLRAGSLSVVESFGRLDNALRRPKPLRV